MNLVRVVGLGLGPQDLTPRAREAVAAAQVLAGGRRLLAMFPDHPGRRLTLAGGVDPWLEQVAQAAETSEVVVLASGDPGFHGIAQRLAQRLGPDHLEILPGISSVQAAFARLKLPWQDAALVSLHGQEGQGLWPALAARDVVAVLTDPARDPAHLGRLLAERGQAAYWRLWVCEDLGAPTERVRSFSPDTAAAEKFSPLNLVVLERLARPRRLTLAAPEEAYVHQAGLITKAEVRAVALGLLALAPGQTLWDLGAGSGAVGLEAGLLTAGGRVLAVEKDPARREQIAANRQALGAGHLEIVAAELPAGLAELPAPDRVFVGGGGDQLPAILEVVGRRLAPGGVVVVSLVKLESLEAARRALAQADMAAEVVQLNISRAAPLTGGMYLKALNPVWLVRGTKPTAGGEA
ncbi:MAG: precorrin-6y C5,15-methyltransferase (decarboxylating) subunit CbiE [Deltaproteobacteria bacterium]|nr:precorrin-6y C5,15-methyltransferase (decarboxylating) subunit CbiE [Deltaproteobacteria bacterium]